MPVERAVIDSWPLLPPGERRSPLIAAVQQRRTTAARLGVALRQRPRTPGTAELRKLIALVAEGCHSELELRGHGSVLADPRLPRAQGQQVVELPSGIIYLDRYFDAEMVDVEFDGAAYHGSQAQRERDVRRDAELLVLGIVTVRLTQQRLLAQDGVVETLLGVLRTRRRQLSLPAVG